MAETRYRAINHKGKREYVFDLKGKYVRTNGKFVIAGKKVVVDPEEAKLKKEFNDLVKGKPYIKSRVKYIKNLKKKIYYAKVWMITEAHDLTVLPHHKKRGFKKYHLDHIYPISIGYENDVPPEIIAHIDNMRFIHHRKNMKKSNILTEEGIKIMARLLKDM